MKEVLLWVKCSPITLHAAEKFCFEEELIDAANSIVVSF